MSPRESQYHQRLGDIGLFFMMPVLCQGDTAMDEMRVPIGDGGHPSLDFFFPARGHCDVPAVDSNVHDYRPPSSIPARDKGYGVTVETLPKTRRVNPRLP